MGRICGDCMDAAYDDGRANDDEEARMYCYENGGRLSYHECHGECSCACRERAGGDPWQQAEH